MRQLVPLLVLIAAASLAAAETDEDTELLQKGLLARMAVVQRATLAPCPGDKSMVAANWESQVQWWGYWQVFHHTGDKIDWVAKIPSEYMEGRGHYVLSCDWVHFNHNGQWMVEVLESTHMGNGGLCLLALKGHELRVVLQTETMGRCWDPPARIKIPFEGTVRFPEERLKAAYQGDSVVLTGKLRVLDQEDKEMSTVPYQEVWKWNEKKRVFEKER